MRALRSTPIEGTVLRRLILTAAAAACLAPAATATAAAPGIVLGGSQFDDAHALDAIHRSGVGWIRVYAYRNELEPRPGVLNARLAGAYAQSVRRHAWEGVRTEIVLVGTPSWESGSGDPLAAPDPAGFARFAERFSRAVPGVAAWEVWQEADAAKWWPAGPTRRPTRRCCRRPTRHCTPSAMRR